MRLWFHRVQAEREEREARVKQRYEATRKDQRRDDHRESDRDSRGRHGGSSRGKDYDSRGKDYDSRDRDRDRYRESRTSDR